MRFKIPFNDNKQFCIVHVADNVRSFKRRNKCHAYYIAADVRKLRSGLFGHIHLSEFNLSPMAHELVAHEVQHMMIDWILCRAGGALTKRNKEKIAAMTGEITRRIWRKIAV